MSTSDESSLEPASPAYIAAVARAVLAVDYAGIHTTAVGRTVIGWVRASHDQILAVAELVLNGHAGATGPNVRTIMDVVLRLIWLNTLDERSAALRGQFQGEQRQSDLHEANLKKLRIPIGLVEPPPEIDLDLFGPLDSQLQGLAARVLDISLDAAKRNESLTGIAGFYHQWQATSQLTHATHALAETYAPRAAFGNSFAHAEALGRSRHLNGVSVVICAIATSILIDEGLPNDQARAFLDASLTA